jgi:hypothetical protein
LTSLDEVAEDIEALLPPPPFGAREDLEDCLLLDGGVPHAAMNGAHRLRFDANGLDERLAAIRGWFRRRGRKEFTWWVGPSATPPGLEAKLRAAGALDFESDPLIASMVLTEPPPAVADVEIRLVDSYEDFADAREIGWEAAGFPDADRKALRAVLRERWEHRRAMGDSALFVALVDGREVAIGDMVFLPFGGFLSGASTLLQFRGRGAYRALVRARWEEVERRGTPALMVGAGAMSRPILERLGFRTVAEIHVLVDSTE